MKKISIAILTLLVVLSACKKVPEVNLKYVDVERDLITVGTTTATVQCDYQYIATLKKACLYYGEGENEADMNTAEMRVVQNTLYVDLSGLKENTTYSYYYEFYNGFNSMRTMAKTFKTETTPIVVVLPTVITAEVTEITESSAQCGGEVTNDGGAEVTERGICWSTNENPTMDHNHVAAGTGIGAFTATMNGLEANTTYHVRAYATNEAGTAYGLDREFVTSSGGGGGCDCDYVDLGLPSGTLWATCNIGANSSDEYGEFIAWGETEPKSLYDWETYKYCYGSNVTLTKYCNDVSYGYNGFTDNLVVLESDDDAATTLLGDGTCIPTIEDWEELIQNTTSIWTTQNCVEGRLFTSTNGNSVFLPAAGNRWLSEYTNAGEGGYYMSSSLSLETPPNPSNNRVFCFDSNECHTNHISSRCYGTSVRPVRKTEIPTPPGNIPEGAINGLFTINENGDQVYFSQGNLQYQASTNTWRFAENQYSFVGGVDYQTGVDCGNVYENGVKCDNTLVSPTYNGWIDLFGWGTSGYHDPDDPYNMCFEPWDTINVSGYGPSYNMSSPDLTGASANYDWGVFNAIANGGNEANLWRTLSKNEWDYMLNLRITTSGSRYAKAIVSDCEGIILLPDDWNNTLFDLQGVNAGTAHFNSNEISLSTWVEIFEKAGAVFLSEAGVRGYYQGTIIYQRYDFDVPGFGIAAPMTYWTVSCADPYDAYCLYIHGNSFSFGICLKSNGRSVRLVQDAR